MAIVGYLSVSAMLMLIDCKYAILSSGGRTGGRSITMESKVSKQLNELEASEPKWGNPVLNIIRVNSLPIN